MIQILKAGSNERGGNDGLRRDNRRFAARFVALRARAWRRWTRRAAHTESGDADGDEQRDRNAWTQCDFAVCGQQHRLLQAALATGERRGRSSLRPTAHYPRSALQLGQKLG